MTLLAPGRNLVLVGMMGTGKSTVGRLVAEHLDRPFADTDEGVEARTGKTVAELFRSLGERGFRALEAEEVRRVAALRGQVIAVGGGAVLDAGNVTHLRATGDLVLLDAAPQELATRLESGGKAVAERPLLAGDDPAGTLARLRSQRDRAYAGAASHTVDTTGRTPEEVAGLVLWWARLVPGLLTREERLALR